ncbi:MAG: hypothetical protein ABF572_10220 [Gluconobacter sp.]|uniref:hypothetical protein n=1 Tax=Gluconobacter sp. TaxID=1876758 RepID=UPI0039EA4A4E
MSFVVEGVHLRIEHARITQGLLVEDSAGRRTLGNLLNSGFCTGFEKRPLICQPFDLEEGQDTGVAEIADFLGPFGQMNRAIGICRHQLQAADLQGRSLVADLFVDDSPCPALTGGPATFAKSEISNGAY